MLRFLSPGHATLLHDHVDVRVQHRSSVFTDYNYSKVVYNKGSSRSYDVTGEQFKLLEGTVEPTLIDLHFVKTLMLSSDRAIALTDSGKLYHQCSYWPFIFHQTEQLADISDSVSSIGIAVLTITGKIYSIKWSPVVFKLILLEIPAVVAKIYYNHTEDLYLTTEGEVYVLSEHGDGIATKLEIPLFEGERVLSVVTRPDGIDYTLFLTDKGRIYIIRLLHKSSIGSFLACNDYILSANIVDDHVFVITVTGKLYSTYCSTPQKANRYGKQCRRRISTEQYEVPGCVVKILDITEADGEDLICTVLTSDGKVYDIVVVSNTGVTLAVSETVRGVSSYLCSFGRYCSLKLSFLLTTGGELYIRRGTSLFQRRSLPFKVNDFSFDPISEHLSLLLLSSNCQVYETGITEK